MTQPLTIAVPKGRVLKSLSARFARAADQGGTLGVGESAAAFGRIIGPEAGTWTFGQWSIAIPYLGGAALMALAAAVGVTVRPADEER